MTITTPTAETISQRLREETRDLHDQAEAHVFQRALLKGEITRQGYAAWLGQLLRLHEGLEGAMRARFDAHAVFALVVTEEQFQTPYLKQDLAALGVEREPTATAATMAAIEAIERDAREAPIRLFGGHYVLEGSNNGSRFIAKKVRRRLGLQAGAGDRYLDPYGEDQPTKWAAFKRALDSAPISGEEAAEMVDAARAMYAHIRAMSDEMLALEGRAAL